MEHTVCLFKMEQQTTKLISVLSTYQRRPCLEFEIEVDPNEHDYPTIKLNWNQRSLRSIQRDLQQLSEVYSRYLTPEDLESMERSAKFMLGLYSELISDGIKKIQETITQQWYTMKMYLNKLERSMSSFYDYVSQYFPFDYIRHEIIEPFVHFVKCFVEKYYDMFSKRIDENLRAFWDAVLKTIIDGLKECCPRGSFCEGFADAIQEMETEKMKMLVSNKVRSMQRRISECLDRIHFPDIQEFLERMFAAYKREMHRIFSAFSEGNLPQLFIQYFERLESFIYEEVKENYEAFVEWLNKILGHLERDEDFRVLKALAIQGKDKAWQILQKGETLAESVWEPVSENLKEYPRKWMQEKMTVQKFSPKEGRIEVQIKHPIESKHIQVAKNIYLSMKNKVNSQ